jgi:hypothetical protein
MANFDRRAPGERGGQQHGPLQLIGLILGITLRDSKTQPGTLADRAGGVGRQSWQECAAEHCIIAVQWCDKQQGCAFCLWRRVLLPTQRSTVSQHGAVQSLPSPPSPNALSHIAVDSVTNPVAGPPATRQLITRRISLVATAQQHGPSSNHAEPRSSPHRMRAPGTRRSPAPAGSNRCRRCRWRSGSPLRAAQPADRPLCGPPRGGGGIRRGRQQRRPRRAAAAGLLPDRAAAGGGGGQAGRGGCISVCLLVGGWLPALLGLGGRWRCEARMLAVSV